MTSLNKVVITLGYRNYVLPHSDGIAIMHLLANAEYVETIHNDDTIAITPISYNDWSLQLFSQKQYEDIKAAMLLGVTYKEYKENVNKRPEESS